MKSLLKMPKQHLPSRKILYLRKQNAVVAQLVEHWLPKPRVAGSSPVYRSTESALMGAFMFFSLKYFIFLLTRPYGHTLTLHSLANKSYDYE